MEPSAVSNVCQTAQYARHLSIYWPTRHLATHCRTTSIYPATGLPSRAERSGAAGGQQRLRRGLGLLRRHAGGAARRATVSSERENDANQALVLACHADIYGCVCVTRRPLAAVPSRFQTFGQRVGDLAVSNVGMFVPAQLVGTWYRIQYSAGPALSRLDARRCHDPEVWIR